MKFEIKDSTILVTGGAGFIGRQLITDLALKGANIKIVDNLTRSNQELLRPILELDKVNFFNADIRYYESFNDLMNGVDFIYHLAATSINRSVNHPHETLDVCVDGSYNVFKSAVDNNVKKVIFASSASVYGNPKILPMKEESPLMPITPYCTSKLMGENLLKYFSFKHDLKYNVLRFFNVYGIGQNVDAYYTSVIIFFIRRLINKQPPMIDGEGTQSMDFINIKDLSRANILALESEQCNEIFNIGSGVSTTISELAQIIIDVMEMDIKAISSGRKSIVAHRRADITKAKQLLGFESQVPLRDGIKEIVEDFKVNYKRYGINKL
jgi:UDP-glucose 4-epimerase